MRKKLLGASSIAALLLTAPVALAQAERGAQGGAESKGVEQGRGDASGVGQRSDVPRGGKDGGGQGGARDRGASGASTGDGAAPGGRAERAPGGEVKGGTEKDSAREKSQATERDRGGKDADTAGQGQTRDSKEGRTTGASEGEDKARTGDATKPGDKASDKEGSGASTGGTPRTGEAGRDQPDKQEADRKVKEVREKVTQTERDSAREAFSKHSDLKRARDVNVRVDVGIGLPRSVTLYDLPDEIVTVVPAYRGYRYVVVEEEIVIVDPATFVVVDVIPHGGRHAAGGGEARLVLTEREQRFIREHVDLDRKSDIRLSVGVDLPGSIELYAFPDPVLSEVPKVRDYRYVVGDDGVAIVDPGSMDVIYVIEG